MSNRKATQVRIWRKMSRVIAGYGMACCILFFIVGCGMLDEPIEERIESVGSQLFGVNVEVDNFHMRVAGGMAEITGFTVANPEGHSADYAVQLELLRLNLGIASTLGGEAIFIEELVIDGPRVNFEQIKPECSNLKELGDNARKTGKQPNSRMTKLQVSLYGSLLAGS